MTNQPLFICTQERNMHLYSETYVHLFAYSYASLLSFSYVSVSLHISNCISIFICICFIFMYNCMFIRNDVPFQMDVYFPIYIQLCLQVPTISLFMSVHICMILHGIGIHFPTHMHIALFIHMYISILICICISIICIYFPTRVHILLFICIYIPISICIYFYIHTHLLLYCVHGTRSLSKDPHFAWGHSGSAKRSGVVGQQTN